MVTTTFDVSSAFDKISFRHIIDEVVAITENPAWGCLLNSYLHGHQIFLDNRHTFRTAGVAQGGVLAPICFAAATWRMGDRLQALTGPYRIRVAIYADDICAKIIANGILGLSQGLKDAVSVIKPWTDRADLHLDPAKNETITDSEITSALLKDHLEDTDIHYIAENTKPSIKWLGLWLTPHNNWRTHIDHAFGKGKRALSTLRRLLVKDWDFSPKLALLGWKTHVIPTLLYGSEIWGGTSSRKWYIEKCTKLEAVFARKLFGLPRSAPTDLASRMLATVCEPIWVQARLRFACYKLHKVGSTQAPVSDNTRKILEGWGVDSVDDRETLCAPVDGISESPPAGVVFNIENGEPPNPPNRSTLCFYSDGSVVDRGNVAAKTGCGVIRCAPDAPHGYEGKSFDTGPFSNIAQCELAGIDNCLQWAHELPRDQSDLYICLDSLAAIRGVQKAFNRRNSRCTELVRSIIQKTDAWVEHANGKVYYWWVRGHQGYLYNELSDVFAARGARAGASTMTHIVRKPLSCTKGQIINTAHHEMEEHWRKVRCTRAVSRIGLGLGRKQLLKIVKTTLKWGAKDRRRLAELISFHSSTRHYRQHLTSTVIDTRCRYCCGPSEDLAHFFSCPATKLSRIRRKIWPDHYSVDFLSGERTSRGMALVRDSLVGAGETGLNRVRRFLRMVAPSWKE